MELSNIYNTLMN